MTTTDPEFVDEYTLETGNEDRSYFLKAISVEHDRMMFHTPLVVTTWGSFLTEALGEFATATINSRDWGNMDVYNAALKLAGVALGVIEQLGTDRNVMCGPEPYFSDGGEFYDGE